jgi:hypothetical protein
MDLQYGKWYINKIVFKIEKYMDRINQYVNRNKFFIKLLVDYILVYLHI